MVKLVVANKIPKNSKMVALCIGLVIGQGSIRYHGNCVHSKLNCHLKHAVIEVDPVLIYMKKRTFQKRLRISPRYYYLFTFMVTLCDLIL